MTVKALPLLIGLIACNPGVAQGIYKTIDAQGNPVFSDTAPNNGDGEAVEEIQLPENINVTDKAQSKEAQQLYKQQQKQYEQEQKEFQRATEGYQSTVKQAGQQLQSAITAKEEGQTMAPGDLVGGRISPARLERLQELDQNVAQAEQELAAAKRNRPSLSTIDNSYEDDNNDPLE